MPFSFAHIMRMCRRGSKNRRAAGTGEDSRFSERRTSNFELRIAPFSPVSPVPPVSRGYPARAVRLTSQSTVLYDADKKMV